MADEWLGQTLTSLHNLWHYQALLLDIRRAIRDDSWSSLAQAWPVLLQERNKAGKATDS
jgi:tRNA-guanine family transglycosylase